MREHLRVWRYFSNMDNLGREDLFVSLLCWAHHSLLHQQCNSCGKENLRWNLCAWRTKEEQNALAELIPFIFKLWDVVSVPIDTGLLWEWSCLLPSFFQKERSRERKGLQFSFLASRAVPLVKFTRAALYWYNHTDTLAEDFMHWHKYTSRDALGMTDSPVVTKPNLYWRKGTFFLV